MSLALILIVASAVAVAFIGAYLWWSERHRKAIEALQLRVAEALRDTQQSTFYFVIAPDASAIEVKLAADAETRARFRSALEARLPESPKQLRVSVLPLEENLDHLCKGVVSWREPGGSVHMACREP